MGSKRFKILDCAYCTKRKSITGDHVFAREFFLPTDRDNLPQAPICAVCNNEKSKLEHYLTALLPFGGRHTQSKENLIELVPKRLDRNQRLKRELKEKQQRIKLIENGIEAETMTLPIREGTIETLFCYIVRGLAWYHWATYISPDSEIEAIALSAHGAQFFQDRFFSLHSNNRIHVNLGNGTVIYEGIQGVDSPQISVWRFHMYGGIVVSEGNDHVFSSEIGVMSGPAQIMRNNP